MSYTASIFQVGELNDGLAAAGLGYRIHLHDMCGGQSFSVEELAKGRHDAGELRAAAEAFFGKLGATVRFDGSGSSFRLE